jgi:outer membrane protein
MKRVALILISAFTLLIISSLAQAATMTLDDCIQLALEKRASIIQARGAASTASASKLSALGAFLPNLYASYNYNGKSKRTNIDPAQQQAVEYVDAIDTTIIGTDTVLDAISVPVAFESITEVETGASKSMGLSANWTIFSPADWFNYASASAAKASARLNVLASEQDMITSVKVAYYAYLAAEQSLSVQREAVKRAEEQLKLIESRFELGSASKSDVLRQKVQYGNDQLTLLQATNGVTESIANLAYTIGLDPREDHQFDPNYRTQDYTGTLNEAIDFSLTHNPSLLSAEKASEESMHSLRATKSSYLPTASLSYNLGHTSSDYSSYNSRSWGLQVSLPIFDGFSREYRVASAKANRNNALAGLSDTRNYTVSLVKSSFLKIEQLKKQQEVSTENVAAAEEDYRITQEKYNLGAATILDLLDAQVSLKEAQVALIKVQFDLNLAFAQLENAMGKV